MQPVRITLRQSLERQGPHHGGAAAEQIAGGPPVVFQIAAPVLEIIEHLEARADMQRVGTDVPGLDGLNSRHPNPHRDRRLERRRRLQSVDCQGLTRCEPLVAPIPPPQFGPLSLRQPHMCVGEDRHQISQGRGINAGQARDDAIAEAEQIITGIDGRRNAVLDMKRRPTIPHQILVLDVVVDKRRLVEDFDGHGGSLGRLTVRLTGRRFFIVPQVGPHGVMRRQADERSKKLAAPGEKIGRHAGRRAKGRDTARRRWPLAEHGPRYRAKHRTKNLT